MGMPIWFDKREIDPGPQRYTKTYLERLLRDSINSSTAFLLLIDDYSLSSPWVKFELSVAEERMRKDPEFIVIPLINTPPTKPLTGILQGITLIDFNRGYKTTLAKLYQRLNPEMKILPGLSVQQAKVSGSRTLKTGMSFADHLKSCGLSPDRSILLQEARNLFAQHKGAPRVTDIVTLVERLDASGSFDVLISGNLPLNIGEEGDRYSLGISFLPTISMSLNRLPSMNDEVRLVFLSIWPSKEDATIENMSTLTVQYNTDGSALLWLSQSSNLHRYTLGSTTTGSIVLTENREMGAHPTAFQWPNNNPNERLLYYRQALANKLGFGQVQQGQMFSEPTSSVTAHSLWMRVDLLQKEAMPIQLTKPRGSIAEVWEKVIADNWQNPEACQATALLAHIGMGGIFVYEVSPHSSVSPLLSIQINHMLNCASAKLFQIPIGDNTESDQVQYLSVSPLQLEIVPEHLMQQRMPNK